ncbi:hypothetical protein Patl1_30643 [Pistacia atlantica]|uniref:Uncharacterized protein n=1 Tax=Pistacia atlantica TaxID=434234 RepID=A0ACC1ABH6_9ROSI|nr:hypothetical protein Patl1_30643 [Pistacia atlantica]
MAKVVDECDSVSGCDKEHAYQPPCGNNTVDGSNAVWDALGLNIDDGVVDLWKVSLSKWSLEFEFIVVLCCVGVQRATLDDSDGQLICINGKCSDNPDVGTHICAKPGPTPSGQCQSSGTLRCNGKSFPQFKCSPTVTSSTKAKLTNNDFSEGGDGGGPSECDGKFHDNSEPVVALSTGWYDGGSRCGKKINIRASNGKV